MLVSGMADRCVVGEWDGRHTCVVVSVMADMCGGEWDGGQVRW